MYVMYFKTLPVPWITLIGMVKLLAVIDISEKKVKIFYLRNYLPFIFMNFIAFYCFLPV